MACGTVHRRGIVVNLVPDQAEVGECMIEGSESLAGGIKIAAAMIGMTLCAAARILNVGMGTTAGLDLPGDFHMACKAQLALRGFQRLVAVAAIWLKLGVRKKTAGLQAGMADGG